MDVTHICRYIQMVYGRMSGCLNNCAHEGVSGCGFETSRMDGKSYRQMDVAYNFSSPFTVQ